MSAPGIPAWVPLRQLRSTVSAIAGEAATGAGVATIMAAIEADMVPVRWSTEIHAWRSGELEKGRELQDARTFAVQALRLLAGPGHSPSLTFALDLVEGIALTPGEPAMRKPAREGVWPLGPVEMAWPLAAFAAIAQAAQPARGAA